MFSLSQRSFQSIRRVVKSTPLTQQLAFSTQFERNLPHMNIGTIGHVDHGKVQTLIL